MYESLAIFGIIMIIMIIVCAIVGIVLYILLAYSMYKMALNEGLENPWISFIPIAQYYILGKLIKNLKVFNYEIPSIEIVLPVATLVSLVCTKIPVLGTLISIVNFVLMLFALNKLYKLYRPENATLYTILSIFGIPVPFIFLSIKDKRQIKNI